MDEEINDELIKLNDLPEFIEIIQKQFDVDFSNYSKASLLRRFNHFVIKKRITTKYDLKYNLINTKGFGKDLIEEITVNFSEFFRDTEMYKTLRTKIFPYLNSYSEINIWSAGCSHGEEPYSIAIILHELGMLDKTNIYATDLNEKVIKHAKSGIFPSEIIQKFSHAYLESGGTESFSDYFNFKYGDVIIKKEIRKKINFFKHNLIADSSFNSFNLVLCRNVMIYFNDFLTNNVLQLLDNSLIDLGYLIIGSKESIRNSTIKDKYEVIDIYERIYKKKGH